MQTSTRLITALIATGVCALPLSAQLGAPGTRDSAAIAKDSKDAAGLPRSASKLIGLAVTNAQNDKVGSVEDVIVDLSSGRVVAVVLSSGGFLGVGDELSVVSPDSFRFNAQRESLQLDISKDALKAAPRYKRGESPDFASPTFTEKMRNAFRRDDHTRSTTDANATATGRTGNSSVVSGRVDADNTGRNVRDRNPGNLTPLDQGNSQADIDTTAAIRKAIVAQGSFSTNAKNVKVITNGGTVTLRGPVNSAEEKQAVARIAGEIAGTDRVTDQLAVKGE